MAKSLMYVCLVIASCSMFALPKAAEQSSSWTILAGNFTQDERTQTLESSENPTTSTTMPTNLTVPCNETKHEDYCSCAVKMCLDPDDYVMVNGTAHVEAYNMSYTVSFYELEGSCLKICAPSFFFPASDDKEIVLDGKYSITLKYITVIGLGISMVCLVMHLIAFILVSDLRNIPGYCMACLSVSLLCGYTSFLVGFDDNIVSSGGPCVATAASTHFFLLSSLLWMNVMAYDVLRSLLNATGKLRIKSTRFSFKNFYMYCIYSWGTALVVAVTAVVSDMVPNFPESYRPHFGKGLCWFRQKNALLVFFAAPVFTVICMNVIFFGLSTYTIISNRMKTDDPHQGMLKRKLVMYVRLAVIMGLSWVAGLLAGIVDAVFLWYVFAILNTLQGFFIFLAFTCTPKVKKHFSTKFPRETMSPTHSNFSHGKSLHDTTVVRRV